MLGFQEPLDCRTACYSGVLDLRTAKAESSTNAWSSEEAMSPQSRTTYSPHHDSCSTVLTPPRDTSMSPPIMPHHMISPALSPQMMDVGVVSPTLAITQRVLAAASAPQGTRPFKAYPKDPLSLSAHSDAFRQFRQHMLNQVRGSKPVNPKKRPSSPISPNQCHNNQQPSSSGHESDDKDAAYWERRRKNNEAAKRSRDARRAKEDEIAIRAAFLEQENLRLKYQVAALTDETAKLRCLLYKSDQSLLASSTM